MSTHTRGAPGSGHCDGARHLIEREPAPLTPRDQAYLSTLILHPFQKASALRALIWREVSMEKLTPFTQQ